MGKVRPVTKGILSRNRLSLSQKQRQEYVRLTAEGVDETTAYELALLITKSAKPKWLKDALAQELTDTALEQVHKAAFDEAAHPREKDGKFGQGSGEPSGMRHEDHYSAALKAGKAALELEQRGDKKGAASMRAARDSQHAKGIAAQKKAIAEFKATTPSQQTKLQDMKNEVERRERLKSVNKQADDGLDLALSALEVEDVSKAAFHTSFKDSAQKILPPYWYDQVHSHARASSGGKASGTVRRHAKDPEAKLNDLWDRRAALVTELEGIDAQLQTLPAPITKAVAPTAQEVHVDVPLGSGKKGKKKAKVKGPQVLEDVMKRSRFDTDLELSDAAFTDPDPMVTDRLLNAQRLVCGMDWEIMVGAEGPEDARARASRNLAQQIGYYDNKLQRDDELRHLKGLDVDVASGQVREPGYLGLDLYPYDFGTAIHDVHRGLPFPDGGVRSIRLLNALQYLTDLSKDPTPLLLEAQRCLTYGGKLTYVGRGDLTQKGDWTQLPGLVLVGHEDSTPLTATQEESESDLYKQTFERVRVRVPRVFGADPTWLGAEEEAASDIDFALTAMGGANPADEAMSDLIQTAMEADWGVPALKSADKNNADVTMGGGGTIKPLADSPAAYQKIIYSVVTAPSELDWDGEFMDAAGIEKMAHDAYRNQVPIKSEHVSDPIGAHIVESYIAPSDLVLTGVDGPQSVPKGSWVVAIQFTDDEEWQKVLTGQYRGISVGGSALIEHR